MTHFVDVRFPVAGEAIPVDHGYRLFSAISEVVPELHGDRAVGVHRVSGPLKGNRLQLVDRTSFLMIRLPSDRIKEVMQLSGRELTIGEHRLFVGPPAALPLIPAPRLYGRLVIIKGFMEADSFIGAVRRQLEALGVKGSASLVARNRLAEPKDGQGVGSHSPYLRRTIRIRDKEIVGFAVRVAELTAEESIRVQEVGIGGRRRFGCGLFIPDRN